MDRLIVKNFGPLKDIDIELNKINLFIGENGSGKSVLAKLITIVTEILNNFDKSEINKFNNFFRKYQVDYINKDTKIVLFGDNEKIIELTYNDCNINYTHNYYDKLENAQNSVLLENGFLSKPDNKIELARYYLILGMVVEYNKYKYIPAERNILSILNDSISSLIRYKIPIPDFLLDFASEYEYARKEIKELEVLNVKYQFDGTDKIYYDKDNYLKLSHSSSGIQSAIPMLLTAKYFAKKYGGIVIEEPEQNLFPKAQDEVVKFIIEQVNGEDNNLFLMTHSPYVLSTLNNLIFAHKVANLNDKAKEQVEEFIKEKQWINPDSFSAYYLEDGVAKSIISKRGLISENIIDDVSDEVENEFNILMEIYREVKDAK